MKDCPPPPPSVSIPPQNIPKLTTTTTTAAAANTPHNPVRFANTVGIVLEQRRPASTLDRLRWYCRVCRRVVHEKSFHCVDLGTQIKDAVNAFRDDVDARTCRRCGTVADVVAPKSGGQD